MKPRLLLLIIVLSVAGLFTNVMARKVPKAFSEQQMEQMLPSVVAGVPYEQGSQAGSSYRMDQRTYDILKPYGIVSRVYPSKRHRYDATIIAGDTPDNFHDPRWCLPNQGWELGSRKETRVETKTRGSVPVSYFIATNRLGEEMTVMYTYRGPRAFHAGINKLAVDMWIGDFVEGTSHAGAFYRFLSMDGANDLEGLKVFVADYLDAANASSKGVF